MYINDLENCTKYCRLNVFADDTMIYISRKNVEDLIVKMNEDLNNIYKYLCFNSLRVNINKCKYIIVNDIKVKIGGRIIINDITLEKVDKIKYLGVLLDDRVKFEIHARYIMNKISR